MNSLGMEEQALLVSEIFGADCTNEFTIFFMNTFLVQLQRSFLPEASSAIVTLKCFGALMYSANVLVQVRLSGENFSTDGTQQIFVLLLFRPFWPLAVSALLRVGSLLS